LIIITFILISNYWIVYLRDVKLAQMSDAEIKTSVPAEMKTTIDVLNQENLIKQQQIEELNKSINELNKTRETNENEFQNYVTQLSKEQQTLKGIVDLLTNEKNELLSRQEDLIKHISLLERQIQTQISKQHNFESVSTEEESIKIDFEKLTHEIDALKAENDSLKVCCTITSL
jgi:hypothetical protein